MTKVYNKLGSVAVEKPGEDILYLNPDDIRLVVTGETFMFNDAQLNRMYELGTFDIIVDINDGNFTTKAQCEDYLLYASDIGNSGASEPSYVMKVINSNTAGTWTEIKWYTTTDEADTPIRTQVVKEGVAPVETPDASKKIIITNS